MLKCSFDDAEQAGFRRVIDGLGLVADKKGMVDIEAALYYNVEALACHADEIHHSDITSMYKYFISRCNVEKGEFRREFCEVSSPVLFS